MREGVSPSVPRKGVPDDDLRSSMVSVPFIRKHVCSFFYVSCTRELVSSGVRYLPESVTGSGLPEKGPLCASVAVTEAVNADVIGIARSSGVLPIGRTDDGFIIPSDSRSTATTGADLTKNIGTADAKLAAAAIAGSVITEEETAATKSSVYRADDGALLPAGQGNVGDGVAGANDAFKAVFGCFSSDLQGVEMPISDLFRFDGQVRPKTLAPVLGVEDLPPFRLVTSDVREGLGINREGSRNVMPSGVVRGSWVTADAITVDSGVHLISGPAGGVLVDANKVAAGDSVGDIIDAADCAKSGRAGNKVAVGSLKVQSTGPTRPKLDRFNRGVRMKFSGSDNSSGRMMCAYGNFA